jgi:threonine dehydrogenase-like Zn-dependent dehydrogenase
MNLRVQTAPGADGAPPRAVDLVRDGARSLDQVAEHILSSFDAALEAFQGAAPMAE